MKKDPVGWVLPIFDLHPSAAVLLMFFFYVGVSTFVIDLPMWLAQGFMPRPGSYLGGLVFAAAIVHFGRKWRAQAQDNSKGQ